MTAGGQRGADTEALRQLSLQTIELVSYRLQVLPLDGSVFWLRGAAIEPIKGSLHFSTDRRQNEDETISVNTVLLTTPVEVTAFNAIGPRLILVAEVKTGPVGAEVPLRVAFTRQAGFYKSAGLWHYSGESLHPALATQLIETGDALPLSTQIVSNSLPAWLALATYDPPWLNAGNPGFVLYPSFAVPQNAVAPYGSVHIEPESTEAVQAISSVVPDLRTGGYTVAQLMRDRVRVTLYGGHNDDGISFLRMVEQYSLDTGVIGITNLPAVRDGKRRQPEFGILAQQKVVNFEITYNQARIADVARQLITSASISITAAP
ncbi:MAG: hypothetical protein B7Z69_00545 [Actinobacteria bacterium 21-73-9]|nr:MAG: hypothetical protein B7Z69_00545 [Actinobacteria bacterium 21-73-9]